MQRVRISLPWFSPWMLGQNLINPESHCWMAYLPRLHYQQLHCIHQHYFSSIRFLHILPATHLLRFPKTFLLHGHVVPPKIRSHTRSLSHTSDDDDDSGIVSDSEFDVKSFDRGRVLNNEKLKCLRVNLYPNSSDPVLKEINEASSVQEVFDVVEKGREYLTAEQSSQAIVTLWDLQKIYGKYGMHCSSVTNSQLNYFIEKIVNHSSFKKLLVSLENVCEDLSNTGISCMLLYLSKLGLRTDTTLMEKLSVLCLERLDGFSLNALSRLTVYLRDQGIKAYFMQSKILPLMADKLKNFSTLDELHLITICFYNTRRLITAPLIDEYRKMIEKHLEEGFFEANQPKVILKIVSLLNYMEWSPKYRLLCHRILLHTIDKVHLLSVAQVMDLTIYFQNFFEPRELFIKIHHYSLSQFEISKDTSDPELLCLAPLSSTRTKKYFEELVAEHLDNSDLHDYIGIIFRVLRYFKISDKRICNDFWINSLNAVEKEIENASSSYLGLKELLRRKVYRRYMYFNNNLGGTYRNFHLENIMSSLLLKDVRSQTGLIPSKLASMVSFLIAYNKSKGLPEDVVGKILECGPQFSISDTLNLSRGIQIALALNPKTTQRRVIEQITAVCRLLDVCAEQHLKTAESLLDVTSITRAYLNRHGSPRTFLFDKIVSAHIPALHELNSRRVRDICHCFLITKYLAPKVLDALAQYIEDNREYILPDIMQHVLDCFYTLGHYPVAGDQFFSICTDIYLKRENLHMKGLNTLQMSLALNMYGHLTSNLIHDIFNITFLDQLDDEISECYSKLQYPIMLSTLRFIRCSLR
nr:FAST kinase domain-containing protein 1, mitochondrial-like isoform X2 [Cherax quadricarinatus]